MIIAKFGGTSLESIEAMRRCATIVAQRCETRVCVVSATAGTTNQLLAVAELARKGQIDSAGIEISALRARHLEMADQLDLEADSREAFEEILNQIEALSQGMALLGEATPRATDQLVSRGEHLSALLFTRTLVNAGVPARFLDARRVIRTDDRFGRAEPQPDQIRLLTRSCLSPLLCDGVVITQGFTGAGLVHIVGHEPDRAGPSNVARPAWPCGRTFDQARPFRREAGGRRSALEVLQFETEPG